MPKIIAFIGQVSTQAGIPPFAALACMFPRIIFISEFPLDAFLEASSVFTVGNLVSLSFGLLRKERERSIQLAALNQISSVVSQSLELSLVLNRSIARVIAVMKVDAALVFLVDEETGELVFIAHWGVSQQFAGGVGKLKVGQGFNGRVAESGEPLFVEDVCRDPGPTRATVAAEGIRSQLIVPLKSKGKVVGTLCAAMRSYRQFRGDEMELLMAIGNQIGVAVENARLYEKEREAVELLRAFHRGAVQSQSPPHFVSLLTFLH